MNGILMKPSIWETKQKVLDQYGLAVTRRLDHLKEINQEPDKFTFSKYIQEPTEPNANGYFVREDGGGVAFIKPRYHTGEVVYVKEAYKIIDVDPEDSGAFPTQVEYADGVQIWLSRPLTIAKIMPDKWRSPLFMPAWAARTFLEIVSVRPERLQDLSYSDYRKEGFEPLIGNWDVSFARLWDSINKDFSWSSNPFVWRIEFKRVARPEAL